MKVFITLALVQVILGVVFNVLVILYVSDEHLDFHHNHQQNHQHKKHGRGGEHPGEGLPFLDGDLGHVVGSHPLVLEVAATNEPQPVS